MDLRMPEMNGLDAIIAIRNEFQIASQLAEHAASIPPETMGAFQWYSWPGNIRELQNLVERAVILSRDGVLPNPLTKICIAPELSSHR
jgi:DNA-binding NtrC family response regulator